MDLNLPNPIWDAYFQESETEFIPIMLDYFDGFRREDLQFCIETFIRVHEKRFENERVFEFFISFLVRYVYKNGQADLTLVISILRTYLIKTLCPPEIFRNVLTLRKVNYGEFIRGQIYGQILPRVMACESSVTSFGMIVRGKVTVTLCAIKYDLFFVPLLENLENLKDTASILK